MIKRNESFYDWCQRTDNQSFLLRWDKELNTDNPYDVYKTNNKGHYFICENNVHSNKFKLINITHHNKIPECPICISFGKWCDDNNHNDFLNRWDYDLNGCSPYDISASSTKKMFFKCPKGIHQSELKDLNNMRKQYKSGRCIACDSIGQYCIDHIDADFFHKYVSSNNSIDLMKTDKNSTKKILIKCQDKNYHPDYEVSCANFYRGERCPYCSGKRVAKEDSLGYLYPESLSIWVENKTSPFDYLPKSNKYIYWKCDKHGNYKRTICDQVESEFLCPKCSKEQSESKLQKKVRLYLETKFSIVNHEYDCSIIPINPETNYKLPYDNEVPEIKLIIEVHGIQHYRQSQWFCSGSNYSDPNEYLKYRQRLDKYKKKYALQHGYSFLEIPYWTDDKKETWKMLIDRKIKSIA